MDELGYNFAESLAWFDHQQEYPYVLIQITNDQAVRILQDMPVPARRCYITDELMAQKAVDNNVSEREVLISKIPDPSSTMAGDFGEILCYFYHSSKYLPANLLGAKKWRLKQDRTKPAPFSDVVHFLMPNRPMASDDDAVYCTESKVKSTNSPSTPITSAIQDCAKDRVSRLSKTLVWLRARGLTEDLGDLDINLLDRFINATDHPAASKHYRAIAIISEEYLKQELQQAPDENDPEFTLVVISIPNLKGTYESVFDAIRGSVSDEVEVEQ